MSSEFIPEIESCLTLEGAVESFKKERHYFDANDCYRGLAVSGFTNVKCSRWILSA